MRLLRSSLTARGLVIIVLVGCGQAKNPATEEKKTEPAKVVAQKKTYPLKFYQGAISPSGAAELTLMVHMN